MLSDVERAGRSMSASEVTPKEGKIYPIRGIYTQEEVKKCVDEAIISMQKLLIVGHDSLTFSPKYNLVISSLMEIKKQMQNE